MQSVSSPSRRFPADILSQTSIHKHRNENDRPSSPCSMRNKRNETTYLRNRPPKVYRRLGASIIDSSSSCKSAPDRHSTARSQIPGSVYTHTSNCSFAMELMIVPRILVVAFRRHSASRDNWICLPCHHQMPFLQSVSIQQAHSREKGHER